MTEEHGDIHVHVHLEGDPRFEVIVDELRALRRRIGDLVTAQQDVDAAIAGIGGDVSRIRAAIVRIQDEIAALQASGADTSGLVAALGELDGATGDLDNVAPAVPGS